jgi:hypothetical protein
MLVNEVPARASMAVLSRELSAAAADGRLTSYLDQPSRIDKLTVTAPHPYFVLDVDDLPEKNLTPPDAYAGWRYLLEVNRRVVALVTTTIDAGGVHRFGGVGTGPAVTSVVYAVHVADELLKGRPEEFRLAAVDVPAVHTVLLRVADPSGARTAYLPVGLATSLHPVRLHSGGEVVRELRRMAGGVRKDRVSDEPVGG